MARSGAIKTGRLLIEPFSGRHLTSAYIGWLNNREVVRYSDQRHKRHTFRGCQDYLRSFEGTPNYFWAISVRSGGERGQIGTMSAYVDEIHRTADIGILIGETHAWGKGYGSEALKAVFGFLFKKAGVRKITAGAISENKRMLRLMRRVGMAPDGRHIRQCLWEEKEADVVHMALFKGRF